MDEAMLSSPDPLNDTPTYQSPQKTRRSSRVRQSLPLQGNSPKKQTFELDVGNQLSPQKIRVTVEAGDSDVENAYTHFIDRGSPSPTREPINRRRERTTTTTIPVKGLSDSEDETQQVATPKRGRGRPRKSAGTPVPAKKRGRASTPTQKAKGKRKSIGDLVDGDDEDDENFQIGKGVEIGRGKGRSRSRSRKSTPASKQTELLDKLVSSTASKKGRGRRKTLLPEEVVVLEDESSGAKELPEAQAEMHGELEPIDSNNACHSPYSTIRSTTTIGADEPDVVLARFDPGNETPRRTGWSSPRIVDAREPSSSRGRVDSYPSPSASPEKSTFSQYDGSVAMVPEPPSERRESGSVDVNHGDYENNRTGEEEEADEEESFDELREFDTILESEGFSLISVDSVPSLREHLSSPLNQPEKGSSKPIRNKRLSNVQDVEATTQNDSFSSIPEEILEAATPGKKAQNPRLQSVQHAREDDLFSSIPPEVLEAATPAKKSQVSRLISRNNSRMDDSFSSVAPEILEAATPGRGPPKQDLPAVKRQSNEDYEDSFSAIPSVILDAATPAVDRQSRPTSDRLSVPGTRLNISPRLPTPEETPSPPVEVSNLQTSGNKGKAIASQSAGRTERQNAAADSSFIHSHVASSPPIIAPRRYTYTAHLRQHRQLHPDVTQTPSIVFSSPSLPPPIQPAREQPSLAPAAEQRPVLSPILRAGRVLQDIVVPSSPRSRSQSLGSPFKSPATDRKSSSSVVRESYPSPQERRAKPLPKLDLNGQLSGHSSHRPQLTSPTHQDDPFRSNAPSVRQGPLPPQDQPQYSLEMPGQRRYSDPRVSNIRSNTESLGSDDAMSWQAEEERSLPIGSASVNGNSSSGIRGPPSDREQTTSSYSALTSEQRYAAERAEVSRQVATASPSKVIVIGSDDDDLPNGHDDDEDFGLLLETLNSSSPVVQQPKEPLKETTEKPRRSKIPSPWRKNSKRLVYSDELSRLSSPIAPRAIIAKGFMKEVTSQPVTVRRIVSQDTSDDIDPADLSGWQIPQKSNFLPRARDSGDLDLSALLAASPPKRLPVLSTSSQLPSFQHQSLSDSSGKPSSELNSSKIFKPVQEKQREETGFTPIPQKLGFKPRARADSPVKQPVPTIFGGAAQGKLSSSYLAPAYSSPISKPLATSSASKTNTLPAHHNPSASAEISQFQSSQDSSSLSSINSNEEKENQVSNTRTLKWAESLRLSSSSAQTPLPISTSPTKSCLRSPLKTPSGGSGTGSGSPTKGVTFVSSSPMYSSPTQPPLSSSIWSKDHWRFLDSILQSWKPENQSSPDSEGKRRRNSTRVISKLLGKNVYAQGEKMKLEQWHLEVVDEFRGYVPGWEEAVVAKRVFALIVGEERRALGLIGGGAEDRVEV
jgi:serine/arginine repetitive matrix protein 2